MTKETEIKVEARLSSVVWIIGAIIFCFTIPGWKIPLAIAIYGLIMAATTEVTLLQYGAKVKK